MALMLLSLPKQQLKTQSSSRSSNYENFILLGDFVSDPTFATD